jgi:hypothetical protein
MKQLFIIFITTFFISFCADDNSRQNLSIKTFDFADKYLAAKRTIEKVNENTYKVTVELNSPTQLEGYVTITDKFANPIQSTDTAEWKFAPYFSSDNELRFVFSDPNKSTGPAVPIPDYRSFKVDYIVKTANGEDFNIDGKVMYLVRKDKYLVPVPELSTSAAY